MTQFFSNLAYMKRAIILLLLTGLLGSCGKDGLLNNKRSYICVNASGNDDGVSRWMTEKQKADYERENNCACSPY
jgi:hypothetical protein